MSIDSSRGNAQSSSSIAVPSAALTASGISSSDSWIFSSGPSIWPEAIRNRIAYPIWPAAPVTTTRAIYEFILSIRATRRAFSMQSIGRRGSIPLARVMGIRIGVDPSWFFVLFLYIWLLSSGYKDAFGPGQDNKAFALAVISALLFFFAVVLHELGHAVVARRNGPHGPRLRADRRRPRALHHHHGQPARALVRRDRVVHQRGRPRRRGAEHAHRAPRGAQGGGRDGRRAGGHRRDDQAGPGRG